MITEKQRAALRLEVALVEFRLLHESLWPADQDTIDQALVIARKEASS